MKRNDGDGEQTCCPVIELRQYTLHSGQRDIMIELFDREFVESQEQLGIRMIGQFRDMDRPDRFVWLRGFSDMETRAKALKAFYGGPIWAAHRTEANATMIDSSNVLLLRPVRSGTGFRIQDLKRAPIAATKIPDTAVVAVIYHLTALSHADFLDFFERAISPAISKAGGPVAACFVTEASENTFPALPVREGENVFVCFSIFRNFTSHENYLAKLNQLSEWKQEILPNLQRWLKCDPEILRLSPTARSLSFR